VVAVGVEEVVVVVAVEEEEEEEEEDGQDKDLRGNPCTR
jgi:hypothetical protein